MSKTNEFLKKYGMDAERIDPEDIAVRMLRDMQNGLSGRKADMQMIPTYLKNDGRVPMNRPAVVIDAGGTNFRCGLVTFTENGFKTESVTKCGMPGADHPVTWEEFISFIADKIMPFMDRADYIGFCFSYMAEITPEIDGRVIAIDKEVTVTDSAGKMLGEALVEELARRGAPGKKAIIVNDTAAVLLGGTAALDKTQYDGFIGQVSGTGTNTCTVVRMRDIPKLCGDEGSIIVNLESGMYADIPVGVMDTVLDENSNNPGSKRFEKLTAGVYLGELARLLIEQAHKDGVICSETAENVAALGKFDAATVDAWINEKKTDCAANAEDAQFLTDISRSLFARSARCMSANLLGIMLLNDSGREKPCCICAEGSLVQKSTFYRTKLLQFMDENCQKAGRKYSFFLGDESTLPGSAAAVLLNK